MQFKNITVTKESVLQSLTDAGLVFEENKDGNGAVLELPDGAIIPILRKKEAKNLQVFWCRFVGDDEWGSFVVALTRTQAKSLFLHSFRDCGEYIDVRCRKVKDVPGDVIIEPGCLDVPKDPVLKKLGLEYQETEI